MMNVQAAPNTQPGGVQGALFRFTYHSDTTPFLVAKPPMAKAAKLINKKRKILPIMVWCLIAKGSIYFAIYLLYLNFKFGGLLGLNDKSPISPKDRFHLYGMVLIANRVYYGYKLI